MCNEAETVQGRPEERIDIWGSCVSRDTLEFLSGFTTGAYVARQSAIVALAPAHGSPVPLDALESAFQRRMVAGDMKADAGARIEEPGSVCVLVDLTDERRGVWRFPDGTYLTNSVEAFLTGIDKWGPEAGARLIEFGTNEHYQLWRQGFTLVMRRIANTGKPVVLLDIPWANVFEGQMPPGGLLSLVGRTARRGQRGIGHFLRAVNGDRSMTGVLVGLRPVPATPGDEFVKVARKANCKYRRYVETAQRLVDATISRSSVAVRMNPSHKWGVGPYHYSDNDYNEICAGLSHILNGRQQGKTADYPRRD